MLRTNLDFLKRIGKSNKGQGMVEYGLIISLIAVACVAALLLLGPKIAAMFNSVANSLA
jgi:pilus assembly protein Flp/PilA